MGQETEKRGGRRVKGQPQPFTLPNAPLSYAHPFTTLSCAGTCCSPSIPCAKPPFHHAWLCSLCIVRHDARIPSQSSLIEFLPLLGLLLFVHWLQPKTSNVVHSVRPSLESMHPPPEEGFEYGKDPRDCVLPLRKGGGR